ncbi:MAG: hypothetical protein ACT4UQ_06600 [Gammaproteobacteria bacterium]
MTQHVSLIAVLIVLAPFIVSLFGLTSWLSAWIFRLPGLVVGLVCAIIWMSPACCGAPILVPVLGTIVLGQLVWLGAGFHVFRWLAGRDLKDMWRTASPIDWRFHSFMTAIASFVSFVILERQGIL